MLPCPYLVTLPLLPSHRNFIPLFRSDFKFWFFIPFLSVSFSFYLTQASRFISFPHPLLSVTSFPGSFPSPPSALSSACSHFFSFPLSCSSLLCCLPYLISPASSFPYSHPFLSPYTHHFSFSTFLLFRSFFSAASSVQFLSFPSHSLSLALPSLMSFPFILLPLHPFPLLPPLAAADDRDLQIIPASRFVYCPVCIDLPFPLSPSHCSTNTPGPAHVTSLHHL